MKRHNTVDDYIEAAEHWQDELIRLRKILKSTNLHETVKWGAPCYTFEGKNVVGIGAFKSYVGLWFYQGALLADKKKVLISAQEGKPVLANSPRANSANMPTTSPTRSAKKPR